MSLIAVESKAKASLKKKSHHGKKSGKKAGPEFIVGHAGVRESCIATVLTQKWKSVLHSSVSITPFMCLRC